jgi:hypothetical protein
MAERVPAAVRTAVVLVWLEVAAIVAGVAGLVVVLVRGTSQMPAPTTALAVLGLALAVGLAGAGLALLRGGRRWARGPVMTAQFLMGAMAVAGWTTTPQPAPPIALALAAAVVTALLVPAS